MNTPTPTCLPSQFTPEQLRNRYLFLYARSYDPSVGRFSTLDPFGGNQNDPQSLHKYMYAHGNPVMGIDPSGNEFNIISISKGVGITAFLLGALATTIGWKTGNDNLRDAGVIAMVAGGNIAGAGVVAQLAGAGEGAKALVLAITLLSGDIFMITAANKLTQVVTPLRFKNAIKQYIEKSFGEDALWGNQSQVMPSRFNLIFAAQDVQGTMRNTLNKSFYETRISNINNIKYKDGDLLITVNCGPSAGGVRQLKMCVYEMNNLGHRKLILEDEFKINDLFIRDSLEETYYDLRD